MDLWCCKKLAAHSFATLQGLNQRSLWNNCNSLITSYHPSCVAFHNILKQRRKARTVNDLRRLILFSSLSCTEIHYGTTEYDFTAKQYDCDAYLPESCLGRQRQNPGQKYVWKVWVNFVFLVYVYLLFEDKNINWKLLYSSHCLVSHFVF